MENNPKKFFFYLNIYIFFTIHSSALKLGIYRFSMSASLLVLSVFMCDRKRGYGSHIDFVNPPYAASFGHYANMVQQIDFIIYTNVQPPRQKFVTKGQDQRSRSKI